MAKRLYQLRAGETLRSIARDQLGDVERWQELAYINSLDPPYFVSPGTVILIPDDSEPLDILVTKGIPPEPTPTRGPAPIASPAQLLALAAGVFLLAWLADKK